jgi:hypothetical protein
VANAEKVLARILSGGADNNIVFGELCSLLRTFGFTERIKGDHHIFYEAGDSRDNQSPAATEWES